MHLITSTCDCADIWGAAAALLAGAPLQVHRPVRHRDVLGPVRRAQGGYKQYVKDYKNCVQDYALIGGKLYIMNRFADIHRPEGGHGGLEGRVEGFKGVYVCVCV
jgi:hypothetical protein